MEIKSIQRVFDTYLGQKRQIIYKTIVDANTHKQIMEQAVIYSKITEVDSIKGKVVDIKT